MTFFLKKKQSVTMLEAVHSLRLLWKYFFFFLMTGESVIATQGAFGVHFKLRRNYIVQDRKSILLWVENFSSTDSALGIKTPESPRNNRTSGKWKRSNFREIENFQK